MRLTKPAAILAATVTVFASLFAAAPASAATLTVTSTVTTFGANSSSPTFTVSATQGISAAFTAFFTDVVNTSTSPFTYWTIPTTCTTTSTTNLSDCGVSSVAVNGTVVSGVQVKRSTAGMSVISFTLPTQAAAGSTLSISYAAGAFTTGAVGSYTTRLILQNGIPGDDGSASITVSASAPSPTPSSSASASASPSASPSASAAPGLAETGTDDWAPLGAAAFLLLAGGALALSRRRTA